MADVSPEVQKPESAAGKEHGPRHRGHHGGAEIRPEPHRGEAGLVGSNFELSFEAAREIAQIVVPIAQAVREKNEEKLVIVSPSEIAAIKKSLVEAGLDLARLYHMPSFEIVELGDGLLHGAKVGEGKDLEGKVLIEKAKDPDRETLTPSQLRKHMRVEEFDKTRGATGPGTPEAGEEEIREPAVSDIREIIAEMKILVKDGRNVETNARWVELSRQLQTAIDSFNRAVEAKRFLEVYEFVQAIDDAEYLADKPLTGDPTREKEALNTILSEERRNQFKETSDNLDSEFQTLYDKLDNKQRGIVFKDLELALGTELIGVKAGWRPFEHARNAIFHVVETGKSREKGLGLDGIREWLATKGLYGAQEQVATELLTRPPARWEDVPEHIASIYQFLETSHFSVDELQIKINQSIQLLEAVPVTSEKSREMRERLVAELEAVRAFHSFRIAMERGDMNPEKVTGVFETYFGNETWKNFVERFDHDIRQRQFIDKDGKAVNLFDEAQKLYFKKLQEERRRLNKIEEMTKRDLRLDTDDDDEKWLILRLVLGREGMKDLKPDQFDEAIANLNGDQKRKVEIWGSNEDLLKVYIGETELAVNDWYEQNTLLGAVSHINERRGEMREKLRDRLIELGMKVKDEKGTETAVADELGQEESEISNFLRSVDFNAYNFSWTMAWSDFDGIRIYGRDGDTQRIKAYAFNQSSHMFFGRHLDHVWEFFATEYRGREAGETEVNEIIRRKFPGKHHNLFPSNRTMVRFARFFVSEEEKKRLRFDERVNKLMNDADFKHPNPEYNEYFRTWAQNVVTAEMIDNGEIDFTTQNFSKTAKDMKKYEMSDLFYDRQYNLNYLKRENFQAYLANPTEDNFAKINNKENVFYSGRNFRQFPWMELALRAHWEVANKHSLRIFHKPNMTAASMENFVEKLTNEGYMEKEQGNAFKRKYLALVPFLGGGAGKNELEILGTVPFRRLRQALEVTRRLAWESKFSPIVILLAVLAAMGFEFARRVPAQATGQGR